MKLLVIVFPFFCVVLFSSQWSLAADPTKAQTKQFLQRTDKALLSAQAAIKKNKVQKGDYVLAIRHQKYAKKMYARNQFKRAVNHSKRARMLAMKVIRDNSVSIPEEARLNRSEYALLGTNVPTGRELDDAIAMDGLYKLQDADVIDKPLDTSIE